MDAGTKVTTCTIHGPRAEGTNIIARPEATLTGKNMTMKKYAIGTSA